MENAKREAELEKKRVKDEVKTGDLFCCRAYVREDYCRICR